MKKNYLLLLLMLLNSLWDIQAKENHGSVAKSMLSVKNLTGTMFVNMVQAATAQVDSVYSYTYNSATGKYDTTKYIFSSTQLTQGYTTTESYYIKDSVSHQWEGTSQYTYVYDADGNTLSYISYYWSTATKSWVQQ